MRNDRLSATPNDMPAPADPASASPCARIRLARMVPLATVAAVSALAYVMVWHRGVSLAVLLERRSDVEAFVAQHWVAALATYTAIYFVVAALSVPIASILTIFGGLVFGVLAATTMALAAATAGATVVFLIAKSALGDWLVRRAGSRVEKVAAGFRADAFNYLLFLRLVPFFPFWLVNLVPALCGVRLGTFVIASALGMIPGTFAYAFFGAGLDSAIKAQNATLELFAGLVALGLLALVPVAVKRFKTARASAEMSSQT
jgi:uncharacterized membrane protein YdjX (TVP38/TMEM64 family)